MISDRDPLTLILHEFPPPTQGTQPPTEGYSGRLVASAALVQAVLRTDAVERVLVVSPSSSLAAWREAGKAYDSGDKLDFLRFDELPAAVRRAGARVIVQSLTPSLRVGMHLRWHCGLPWMPAVGLTHDLSSAAVYDELLLSQIGRPTPHDAIVATSPAALAALRRLLVIAETATGVSPGPGTAMIPLAVGSFTPGSRGAARRRWRVSDRTVVFLAFGRINYRMKVDLAPALDAFASSCGGRDALFVIAGGLAGSEDKDSVRRYTDLADRLGVSSRVRIIPDIDDDAKRDAFAGADVALALADSYQESFGLVLVEAMLSGLPVIASDFDGYRYVLGDAGAGILVPTTAPATSAGVSAAAPVEDRAWVYEALSQCVGTDGDRLRDAMVRLAHDADSRRRMGSVGRSSAAARFGWDTVMTQHLELWERLLALGRKYAGRPCSPYWYDHADVFCEHPTRRIDAQIRVVRVATAGRDRLPDCVPQFDDKRVHEALARLGDRTRPIVNVLGSDEASIRGAASMLKHGLIRPA